jgi:hypothetical protein
MNLLADIQALEEKARALRPAKLEMWPEEFRALPNESARSALFTVRRGKRQYFEGASLVVLGDGELVYRGQELRTDDEAVWLQVLHLARLQPLAEWVEFSPYAVLRALSWPTNGTYYKRLRVHLARMQATALEVTSKRLGRRVSISLIRKFECEAEGKPLERWRVWIEREMRELFGRHSFTLTEWESRKKLRPIAKRLCDFFGSHKEPFPVKIEKLRDLCASECAARTKWRQLVRGALDELMRAGFLTSWTIDRHDRVNVRRR